MNFQALHEILFIIRDLKVKTRSLGDPSPAATMAYGLSRGNHILFAMSSPVEPAPGLIRVKSMITGHRAFIRIPNLKFRVMMVRRSRVTPSRTPTCYNPFQSTVHLEPFQVAIYEIIHDITM